MSKPIEDKGQKDFMVFEKLNVTREDAVLFAAINAPPMNLEGPELIRDLVCGEVIGIVVLGDRLTGVSMHGLVSGEEDDASVH